MRVWKACVRPHAWTVCMPVSAWPWSYSQSASGLMRARFAGFSGAARCARRRSSAATSASVCQTRSRSKPSVIGSTVPPAASIRAQPALAELEDAGFHRQVAVEVAEPADAQRRAASKSSSRAANDSSAAIAAARARPSPPGRRAARRRLSPCAPIGPSVLSSATQTSAAGQRGTRPWLGRKP